MISQEFGNKLTRMGGMKLSGQHTHTLTADSMQVMALQALSELKATVEQLPVS
jgi:hypothetical protein